MNIGFRFPWVITAGITSELDRRAGALSALAPGKGVCELLRQVS